MKKKLQQKFLLGLISCQLKQKHCILENQRFKILWRDFIRHKADEGFYLLIVESIKNTNCIACAVHNLLLNWLELPFDVGPFISTESHIKFYLLALQHLVAEKHNSIAQQKQRSDMKILRIACTAGPGTAKSPLSLTESHLLPRQQHYAFIQSAKMSLKNPKPCTNNNNLLPTAILIKKHTKRSSFLLRRISHQLSSSDPFCSRVNTGRRAGFLRNRRLGLLLIESYKGAFQVKRLQIFFLRFDFLKKMGYHQSILLKFLKHYRSGQ